jgi:hypothetical protein
MMFLCNVLNEVGYTLVLICHNKWGGLVVKKMIFIFGVQDQSPQMTWVVVNVRMLIKYSLPT